MAGKSIDVHTPDGSNAGSVELPAALFDVDANIALMHQVVTAQLAAARQGTHATKTRAMVSGGGKKPLKSSTSTSTAPSQVSFKWSARHRQNSRRRPKAC